VQDLGAAVRAFRPLMRSAGQVRLLSVKLW
jgi:hypothetical protein